MNFESRLTEITTPAIVHGELLSVQESLDLHAPDQGGIEFQTDQPGKRHGWHSHDVTERLIILEGSMMLEWRDGEKGKNQLVEAGDVIDLPANTVHQSTTGTSVCRYLIRPEGGAAAHTTVHSARTRSEPRMCGH